MSHEHKTEQDWQAYSTLLTLWKDENPIKTIKLQFLLATNAGLLGFLQLGGGLVPENILLLWGGFILNLIWTLSLGRTSLFQKVWKHKLDTIAHHHPNDTRFQILDIQAAERSAPAWLRILGGVSSKYYLIGAPVGMALAWLLAAVFVSR